MAQPFLAEEEVEETRDPKDELEEVLFDLHDNWWKYRGHAVPMNLVFLVRELRQK